MIEMTAVVEANSRSNLLHAEPSCFQQPAGFTDTCAKQEGLKRVSGVLLDETAQMLGGNTKARCNEGDRKTSLGISLFDHVQRTKDVRIQRFHHQRYVPV